MARAFFYGHGAALAFKVSFLSGGTRVVMGLEVLWKSPLSRTHSEGGIGRGDRRTAIAGFGHLLAVDTWCCGRRFLTKLLTCREMISTSEQIISSPVYSCMNIRVPL